MKNIIKLFFLIVIISMNSSACEIESYKYILRFSDNFSNDIIAKSTCSKMINQSFIKLIMSSSGKTSSQIIANLLSEKSNSPINIIPKNIQIQSINDIISKRSRLSKDQRIMSSKSANHLKSIQSNEFFNINIGCSSCLKTGENTLKISINDKSFWVTTIVQRAIKVWVSKKDISPFEKNINKSDFTLVTLFDHSNKSFFQDINHIHFYKTNRAIKKNDALLQNHLSSKVLVNQGKKVLINLISKNVKLKNFVISKQNGKFGDLIEVQNIKSKKKFFAKVINNNTVEVDL